MSLINHRAREIHFKIVYYGPSLGGKTTNLKVLHERLPADRRGKLLSIATDHERTLFFDFLPFALGQIQGYTTRIHLYTTPGQSYYRLSRRAVLQGLDGVVFVADSHPARESANHESLADLNDHLTALGISDAERARIGWVFQYNKRDVTAALPLARLKAALNPKGALEFEAVAVEGRGVAETLRAACKVVIAHANLSGLLPVNGAAVPAPAIPVTAHTTSGGVAVAEAPTVVAAPAAVLPAAIAPAVAAPVVVVTPPAPAVVPPVAIVPPAPVVPATRRRRRTGSRAARRSR